MQHRIGPSRTDRGTFRLLLLAASVLAMLGFEQAPLSPAELEATSTDIVLGVVESRSMQEDRDDSWLERTFDYDVRVEETFKGDLERGATVVVRAGTRRWIGPDPMPPSGTGHQPLPLVGELAQFHLVPADDGSGRYLVVAPNGVELGSGARLDDPTRMGDPPPVEAPEDSAEVAAKNKDPFGWDVVLFLLAVPILVGSLRQSGSARWILLAISTTMLLGAAAVVLL